MLLIQRNLCSGCKTNPRKKFLIRKSILGERKSNSMNDRNKEWNEKSLTAWNQWKSICSICGCPDESRQILMVEVANAFQKKLHSVIGTELDYLFYDNYKTILGKEEISESDTLPSQTGHLPSDGSFYFSEDYGKEVAEFDKNLEDLVPQDDADGRKFNSEPSDDLESVAGQNYQDDGEAEDVLEDNAEPGSEKKAEKRFRVDWAHEFDCGIIEKANHEKSPKNYKDYTWECISRSNDPPLKIIRGQLLGHLGIINEIAERFLRNNFYQIWEKQISLQTPAGTDKDDSGTLEDTIPDKKTDSSLDPSEEKFLRKCFRNLFSNDNAAIFLVYLSGFSTMFPKKISISHEELQKYTGLSSSSLYDRINNFILPKIQALPKECLQVMQISGASDFLIFLMIDQIKPEKKAEKLLHTVENAIVTAEMEEANE